MEERGSRFDGLRTPPDRRGAEPSRSAGSGSRADDSRVVDALQDYLRLLENHQAPSRSAFLARHPQIAEPLAAALDGLNLLHHVSSGIRHLPAPPKPAAPEFVQPTLPLGDFRIIREVGRGGMGVVYEAEQLSLGRRVALKVLPFAAALDAKQLARFKNEAAAAAHLHHTNIVPVFAVGADRGVHYYAMQFIEGQTLADLIRERRQLEKPQGAAGEAAPPEPSSFVGPPPARIEPRQTHVPGEQRPSSVVRILSDDSATAPYPGRGKHGAPAGPGAAAGQSPVPSDVPIRKGPAAEPTAGSTRAVGVGQTTRPAGRGLDWWKSLARLGLQAAEALEYAHSMGVVHRDIKPANMLVDHRGNLWVTDFGLAHFRRSGELTLSGDLLGTARYMSPEQTRGERSRVDHHTDIYSLGVTLYELFTLRHAFDGKGWNDLMRQIAFEEPKAPRKVRSDVPAELEIIVQKAMSKNPAERYATAADMAEDLKRFIEDRPILAKRPTLLQHASKFARRHRAILGGAVALLVVAFVALSWFYLELYHQVQETQRNAIRARENVDRAWIATDLMYLDFAEQWLKNHPQLTEDQREFLRKARDLYLQFAREEGQQPEIRHRRALAQFRVAEIERAFRNYSRAQAAYAAAGRTFRELRDANLQNFGYQLDLARTWGGEGLLMLDLKELNQARKRFEDALGALEGCRALISTARPSERDALLLELAVQQANYGEAHYRLRQFSTAQESFRDSLERLEDLRRARFERAKVRDASDAVLEEVKAARLAIEPELARTHLLYGMLSHATGAMAEARSHWRQALDLAKTLAESYPSEFKFKSIQSSYLKQIGQRCYECGQFREADGYLREAYALNNQLALGLSSVDARRETASCLALLARIARERGRLNDAIALYEEERELRERLQERSETDRKQLGVTCNNLGHVLLDHQRPSEALRAFSQALAIEKETFDSFAGSPADRHRLAVYWNNLAKALWRLDRRSDAAEAFEAAVKLSEEALEQAPSRPDWRPVEYRDAAAKLHRNFAQFLMSEGNLRGAEAELKAAMAQELKLCDECEQEPRWHIQLAQSHLRLASLYERQRQPGLAAGRYLKAGAILADLTTRIAPDNAEAQTRLAWFLASCPDPTQRDYAKAKAAAAKAMKVELRQDDTLADAKRTLGLCALRDGDAAAAIPLLEESCRERERSDPVALMLLAVAHGQVGERKHAAGDFAGSVRAFVLAAESFSAAGIEAKKRLGGEDEEYQQFHAEFVNSFQPMLAAGRKSEP